MRYGRTFEVIEEYLDYKSNIETEGLRRLHGAKELRQEFMNNTLGHVTVACLKPELFNGARNKFIAARNVYEAVTKKCGYKDKMPAKHKDFQKRVDAMKEAMKKGEL